MVIYASYNRHRAACPHSWAAQHGCVAHGGAHPNSGHEVVLTRASGNGRAGHGAVIAGSGGDAMALWHEGNG